MKKNSALMQNSRGETIPPLEEKQVFARVLSDDGIIPNNRLPLLIYSGALPPKEKSDAETAERVLGTNRWGGMWRNGIFTFHHYHSTAHEVLVVFAGSAEVQLGGEHGITRKVTAGDVIIIPAGVAHKNLGASKDFAVVGAYPSGQSWDLCYGKRAERPRVDRNIAAVPLPSSDPIFGAAGPLLNHWR